MIHITPDIVINESEIHEEFIRTSGPGGQNVNKVSTAVQLRFDVAGSTSLPNGVRRRLIQLGGKRITSSGVLIIKAQRYRTQEKNREDALKRLVELVRKAVEKPKSRRKTRPSQKSKEKRLERKRQRGQIKAARKTVTRFGE